jgi:hypothetical protein
VLLIARAKADVAQLAERVLGKDEVTSSILVIGSNLRRSRLAQAEHGELSAEARRGGISSEGKADR